MPCGINVRTCCRSRGLASSDRPAVEMARKRRGLCRGFAFDDDLTGPSPSTLAKAFCASTRSSWTDTTDHPRRMATFARAPRGAGRSGDDKDADAQKQGVTGRMGRENPWDLVWT